MERKDLIYVLFWSFALAFALAFLGLGAKSVFLFSLSLVSIAFVEKVERKRYAVGAAFLAFAFAAYFGEDPLFISQLFAAALLFMILPFVLLEARKRMRK